jgi:hypothetical protein
MLASLYGA